MLGPDAAKDLDGALRAVAGIGYRAVELYTFYDRTPKQFRAALDAAGLLCPSSQVRGRGQLDGDLGKLANDLTTLGVRTAVMTTPNIPDRLGRSPSPGEGIGEWLRRVVGQLTADDWKMNADFLNEKAAVMARSGIKLGYHNHDFEFIPLGGVTGLDILLKHTDPALVTFQLDVGWAASAGVDPMALLSKYKGRFSLMHVKDIKVGAQPNFSLHMEPAELGTGQLVWKDLLPAAYSAGVRDFYVEQEAPFTRPRLEAAKINHDFLARLS